MSDLDKAIQLVAGQIEKESAWVVIAEEGCPEVESSLMGTRDGYLNLIKTLLSFVAACDKGEHWDEEEKAHWDDEIKTVMNQIAVGGVGLVGAYLFKTHEELIGALSKFYDWRIGYPLSSDPDFGEPTE